MHVPEFGLQGAQSQPGEVWEHAGLGIEQLSHLLPSDQQDAVLLAVLDLAVDVVQHQQLTPAILQQCHLVSHLQGRTMQRSSWDCPSGPSPQFSTQSLIWVPPIYFNGAQ